MFIVTQQRHKLKTCQTAKLVPVPVVKTPQKVDSKLIANSIKDRISDDSCKVESTMFYVY